MRSWIQIAGRPWAHTALGPANASSTVPIAGQSVAMRSEERNFARSGAVPWGLALMLICVFIALSSSPLAAQNGQRGWLKKAFKESRRQEQTQSKERPGVARPSRNYARKPSSVRSPSDSASAVPNSPQIISTIPVRVALLIGNQAYDPSVGTLKNP